MDVVAAHNTHLEGDDATGKKIDMDLRVMEQSEVLSKENLSPGTTNKKRLHDVDAILVVGPKKACLLHESSGGDVPQQQQHHHHQQQELMQLLQSGEITLSNAIARIGSVLEILQLFEYLFQSNHVESFALELLLDFWRLFPESAQEEVLPLFSRFECWQQLLLFIKVAKGSRLKRSIYSASLAVFQKQWEQDLACVQTNHDKGVHQQTTTATAANNHNNKLSSMALWLPRERGKWDKELDFVRRFTRVLYPTYPRQAAKALYRKQVKLFCEAQKSKSPDNTTTSHRSKMENASPDNTNTAGPLFLTEQVDRKPLTSRWKPTNGQSLLFSFPTLIRLPGKRRLNQTAVHTDTPTSSSSNCLTLPRTDRVDQYFMTDPFLTSAGEDFLQKGTRHFTRHSEEGILYIHQGEVGHATPKQCDVIVSDRATTCHILAFRSSSGGVPSLTSLAHIDGPIYDDCIQSMVEAHIAHHRNNWKDASSIDDDADDYSERPSSAPAASLDQPPPVDIQIHICGGFDDDRYSSDRITEWLMHLLAWLADEYQDDVTMTLQTCVVSTMNDTGYTPTPVGRGMAVDLRTGEAFMAKVDADVCGPAQQVRSARIWSPGDGTLNQVFTSASNEFVIRPFSFQGCQRHEDFLKLPNEKMISKTSTSPNVEESDFCLSVRNTLRFMREVSCDQVFGIGQDCPLVFRRIGVSNAWMRVR